jgi:hypothetical protein
MAADRHIKTHGDHRLRHPRRHPWSLVDSSELDSKLAFTHALPDLY